MQAAKSSVSYAASSYLESMKNQPWQGAFFTGQIRLLQWSDDWPPDTAYAFATQQVRQLPYQLQFHLCRIYFALVRRNQDALYASLLDLFWVLGRGGFDLKKRMLKGARPLLEEGRYLALMACLKNEITPRQLPFSSLSVLNDGATGSLQLIEAV